MPSTRWRALAVLAVTVVALTGCNDDGRTLAPTSATMPTSATPATEPAAEVTGMRITSPDVVEGAALDPQFTCDGGGAAPELVLEGAPLAAAELAVVVVDLDAADRVHLAVSGLPSTTARLDLDDPPDGALLGLTDGGDVGWEPPCPPPGEGAHRYEFRLYAMTEPVGLAPGVPGREAVGLLDRAAIDVARLGFTYAAASG